MSYSGELEANGFVVAHNVFTADEIAALRRDAFRILERPAFPGDVDGHAFYNRVRYDVYNRNPEVRWLLTDERVVRVLRAAVGPDFVYLPEGALHDSGFGGWHKDTTAQETAGHRFQWDPDYQMVQVGLYLQDNDVDYAGGLDVIPRSHRRPDRLAAAPTRNPLRRVARKARITVEPVLRRVSALSIPSQAGDFVLFDFRLDHKATTPRRAVPEARRKLAFFFAVSRKNRHVDAYVRYIQGRRDYSYLSNYRLDSSFEQQLRQLGLTMALPPGV